jgi:phage portal protein BeeE
MGRNKHRNTSKAIQKRDSAVPTLAGWSGNSFVSMLSIPSGAYPLTVVEAAGISAVRRCVSLIANGIAGQRWTEWIGTEQIKPVSRIVRRPAAIMSRREWVWRVVASMALTDISYLYMTGGVDDEGVPGSLIPLPREAVLPSGFIDPFGVFPPTKYTISGIPGEISSEYIVPMRSAFWPGVPPHLVGILQMARNTMMTAHASDNYQSRFWQAGGAPATQITTDQELTDTQAQDIGARWRDRRAKGPDFPAVLGKGAKAEPWGADIANTLAVEAKREISVEVANLFGVPARYLNITPTGSSQTYANLNDEALSLERFTLTGFTDPIQDVVSDLLPDPMDDERFMLIDMTRLTRAGQEARFRAWAIATGNKPWMMPDEVRAEEGMAPNPDIMKLEEAQVKGSEAAAESFANRAAGSTEEAPEKETADA